MRYLKYLEHKGGIKKCDFKKITRFSETKTAGWGSEPFYSPGCQEVLPGVWMQTLGSLPLSLEIHCQPLSCKVSSLLLPCIQDCSGRRHLTGQCGPWASSSSITWEPVGNIHSQPPCPLICLPDGMSTEGHKPCWPCHPPQPGGSWRVTFMACLNSPSWKTKMALFYFLCWG